MPGRGMIDDKNDNQPNKSAISNKQEIIPPVNENESQISDIIASPILPESSIEPKFYQTCCFNKQFQFKQ